MGDMKKISASRFARTLKKDCNQEDNRFVLFLGSGCSASSGIRTAGQLVQEKWLPELMSLETGAEHKSCDGWAKKKFPEYDPDNAALFYGEVMEELFPSPNKRQREVEEICDGVFPGFGYAVLATLIAETKGAFSNILTTNFDDLLGDAFYLFTNVKPLIIQHESLAGFITSRTRPLIVKVHGDSRISPYNTKEEIEKLTDRMQKSLRELISGKGLIFMGYGGNDPGIVEMLKGLPEEAKNHEVYWAGRSEPQGEIRPWLEERNSIHVEIKGFDEIMLFLRNAFDLPLPESGRFDHVFEKCRKTYEEFRGRVEKLDDASQGSKELKEAVEKTDRSFSGWYAVNLEAEKYEKSDPEKADEIYQEGLKQFPTSAPLLSNYAVFLKNICKDYDSAEEHYKRALMADPNDADYLGNYAGFLLGMGRKDEGRAFMDKAAGHPDLKNKKDLEAEILFYGYANSPVENRERNLKGLKAMLLEGVTSPGWEFSLNIEQAKKEKHPEAKWLQTLADVITEKAEIKKLEKWPAWKNA